jgi:hypothetical protein
VAGHSAVTIEAIPSLLPRSATRWRASSAPRFFGATRRISSASWWVRWSPSTRPMIHIATMVSGTTEMMA